MVARLPAEEDRLSAYTRLLRERFGEGPKEINEGASIVPLMSEWDGPTCGEQCRHMICPPFAAA